jgi:hypothetical protein
MTLERRRGRPEVLIFPDHTATEQIIPTGSLPTV